MPENSPNDSRALALNPESTDRVKTPDSSAGAAPDEKQSVTLPFCPDCGTFLDHLIDQQMCPDCGRTYTLDNSDGRWECVDEIDPYKSSGDRMAADDQEAYHVTDHVCPECGHDEATVTTKQIRAADESETRLYECVECGHRTREDDN